MALVAAELLGDWVVKPAAIETADAVTVFGRTDRAAGERSARARARRDRRGRRHQRRGAGASQAFVDELRRQMRQSDVVACSVRAKWVFSSRHDRGARAAVARRLRTALSAIARRALVDQGDRFATRCRARVWPMGS
jgi:hypothetical protein